MLFCSIFILLYLSNHKAEGKQVVRNVLYSLQMKSPWRNLTLFCHCPHNNLTSKGSCFSYHLHVQQVISLRSVFLESQVSQAII
jgi:hypothetical protein